MALHKVTCPLVKGTLVTLYLDLISLEFSIRKVPLGASEGRSKGLATFWGDLVARTRVHSFCQVQDKGNFRMRLVLCVRPVLVNNVNIAFTPAPEKNSRMLELFLDAFYPAPLLRRRSKNFEKAKERRAERIEAGKDKVRKTFNGVCAVPGVQSSTTGPGISPASRSSSMPWQKLTFVLVC